MASFPSILQESSWTVAVPYKQRILDHTPSESIANNYSPSSWHLKIQHLADVKLVFPDTDKVINKSVKSSKISNRSQGVVGITHKEFFPSTRSNVDPQSRPLSPMEQVKMIVTNREKSAQKLSHQKLERYSHYVSHGIKKNMIEKPSTIQREKITKKLKRYGHTGCSVEVNDHLQLLLNEMEKDYYFSIQKSIVDYILLDKGDCVRIGVPNIPEDHCPCTIRSPVSWHEAVLHSKSVISGYLFIGSPVILALNDLWFKQFSHLRFINSFDIFQRDKCFTPDELLMTVKVQCMTTKRFLETTWLNACCDIIGQLKDCWSSMVPNKYDRSIHQVNSLFRCIATFMSMKLRSIVEATLDDFLTMIKNYEAGNNYCDTYLPETFFKHPLLKIEIIVEGNSVRFQPDLNVAQQKLTDCIYEVIQANHEIPRVEKAMGFKGNISHASLFPVCHDEDIVKECSAKILEVLKKNTPGPHIYIKCYEKYLPLTSVTCEEEIQNSLDKDAGLKLLREKLNFLEEMKTEIIMLRQYEWLNLVCLDASSINQQLCDRIDYLKALILNHLIEKTRAINRKLCRSFEEICSRAGETPPTTALLVSLSDYLRMSKNIIAYDLREDIGEISKNIMFLVDFTNLTADDIALNSRVFNWPETIRNMIEMSNSRITMRQNQIEADLRKRLIEFEDKVAVCGKELDVLRKRDPPVLNIDEMKISVQILKKLTMLLDEAKQELTAINDEEKLLGDEPTAFPAVQAMILFKEPYDKLWNTALNFTEKYEIWFNGPFKDLNAEIVAEEVDAMWKTIYKLSKTFADYPGPKRVADNIKVRVEKFRQTLPVLHMICNSGMQERHWEAVSTVVGHSVVPSNEASLSEMIDAGLPQHVQRIEEISMVATKENSLENSLAKMMQEWQDVHFEMIPYRETGVSILTTVDDFQLMLDDHILRVQTMRGSPYIKPLEKSIKSWEDKLILMQDIVDTWLKCQSTWLYLEPIFGSEDITKQMPVESRKFARVDQTWRELMAGVLSDTRALIATSIPYMLQKLEENNRLLEEIQKGLNNYLDKKRLFFPRFFFLSNDELLEILSETKDPTRVQPHLKKIYEGIYGLEFGDDEAILGMISAENENVMFEEKVYPAACKGLVEKWLAEVEQSMIVSLRTITAKAYDVYGSKTLTEWIAMWPGQVVLCARCIQWTEEITKAISTLQGKNLKEWYKTYVAEKSSELEEVVAMVRQKLNPGLQLTLESLIVIDVHARDVALKLLEDDVSDVHDFNWISQLRYYWSDNRSGVTVHMVATEVNYGFEYLGNSGRLVITPLTDRCFRTLMGALKLNLGGAPEGPAGTGKTETVKDLAKAVAKHCVVFNCSEGLDYTAMGKFFKGLAQAGSWACFDEFNRIDMDVLSVVAQQIHCIQLAKSQGLAKFVFEDVELILNPSCAVFITMNPGYSGRQELPDNLKVLFRTVAMMVPDYSMIAEICLYSTGFVNARYLACKIVHTYRLCSEQLSQQHHYDYGMRAVKTVLITAGHLKREYPDEDEAVLVLKALRNVNGPKFLAQDALLFEGIISDLFPTVTNTSCGSSHLREILKNVLNDSNLQPIPAFIEKIIQLYETLLVRHGIMLIGGSLSGKTTAYRILGEALFRMEKLKVIYKVINPKALTLGQLYGSFDSASHEWSDGVLAHSFREFATSTSTDLKWIVFDGPVDALWVEHMNTVLDDNKKLCLMNSEIIQMSNEMRLIFESADLVHTSPATVSRCGMIYLEPQQLGWKALKESYLNLLPSIVERVQRRMVSDMMDWLFPPTLEFVMTECQAFVELSELHLCSSTLRFYDLLLDELRFSNKEGHPTYHNQQVTNWLQTLLLFAIVWGVGGTLSNISRVKFDSFYRNLIYGNNENHIRPTTFRLSRLQMFPEKKLVFDYAFEKKGSGQWVYWMDVVDKNQWTLFPRTNWDFIVPTNETARQTYFLAHCLQHKIPLLIVGPTGTGKSAVTNAYLSSLPKDKYVINSINFSARTSSDQAHDIVMSRLDRRRKGIFGPPLGRKCIVFIDDLNLPTKEKWGSQPPIELLRQWLDSGYWYDKKDTTKLELIDTLLLAAMGPHGTGGNDVSPRFMRHFFIVTMDSFDDQSLLKIFGSIVDFHFNNGYDGNIQQMTKMLVQATLSVYKATILNFLPTPLKSHYVFSLRDITRVIRGILQVPSTHLKSTEKLIRLWFHEVYRVFHDRLIDDKDRCNFFDIVKGICQRDFRHSLDSLFSHMSDSNGIKEHQMNLLFFGSYVETDSDQNVYDEITDQKKLVEVMESYLKEYNTLSWTSFNFVPFHYAIQHVSRLTRVLLQDGGHALLIGINGSGRQSTTRMAAFIMDMELQCIEISRSYGISEWREDLKRILRKAGTEGKAFVFLITDDNIKDDTFLEDINMILITGCIPNLYNAEEKAEILEKIQILLKEMGEQVENSPSTLYDFFIERVRRHLHIVITISPIGDEFRKRLLNFPALINCCTIDWFSPWPNEALEMVAGRYLTDCDLDADLKANCVTICQYFHKSIIQLSEKYYAFLRRRNYVTPTSYLQFIFTFTQLLEKKRNEICMLHNRYIVGLEKLDFATTQVGVMQDELTAERPKLVKTTEETEKLMIKIEQDTIAVEAKKEVVAADEALANAAAAEAQAIKDECENDLVEATPALESAIAALNTLKPQDITLIKSMKNPPAGVKLVMEAICIMKGIKPERKREPGGTGKMIQDYWSPSQKVLGDLKFLENLKEYDKDNIPLSIMKVIRQKYIPNPEFDPLIIRNVSTACEGLCQWICAIEVYDRVAKIVAPKKEKLSKAATDLGKQMEKLNKKRSQLQEVTDKLQILNDEFIKKTKEKKDLEDSIELCCKKLGRAEKLIGGLGGEKHRWSALALSLAKQFGNVVGDVILSAGIIAYLGAFTSEFRQECISQWLQMCRELKIPCSEPYSFINTMGNLVEIRAWAIAGLPVDNFSIDNGIIVSNSRRWSLMVDPQGQANKWIKSFEKSSNLEVVRLSDPNYVRVLDRCIQLGIPVLIEDVGQELDPLLHPLLLKQTFKKGAMEYIRLADNTIEYNGSFRLYMTTRLPNPHYFPDVFAKMTILNFTITPIGLEDQLLGCVVAKEKPELEERKNILIVEGANNKRLLKEIEDKILEVLSTSEGNILDDETAIGILSSSKVLSEEISAKQEVAANTEIQIDETRNLYRPVANHSSTLFFCVSQLANIDPMYQYSLSWFMKLFLQSITNSPKTSDLKERTAKLNAHFTYSIYRNVCRSLFEKDKLVFACILCVGLLNAKGSVDENIWTFILKGGVILDNPYRNPAAEWMTNTSWEEIVSLSELENFHGLVEHVTEKVSLWRVVHDSLKPHQEIFPHPYDRIRGLEKMAILRCFRPDKLVPAMQDFICKHLGPAYIEPPPFDLAESYMDSTSCTPLIFILSPGADPMADLLRFGQDLGYTQERIHIVSLGQGQGTMATSLIESTLEDGSWVVLQNCHLVSTWLPTLEKLCQELIVPEVAHRNFRLWLTCYPTNDFPISILQSGVKMTNEAPRGLRANLLRTFLNIPISDASFFGGCARSREWQRLLFGLCFFHALIQERQCFGPLGWNIPYEFNDSDLRISLLQLQMFLNQSSEDLPLNVLTYLTGECNYGGRVTDESDRRLLLSLLSKFYNKDIIFTEDYQLAADDCKYYCLPSATDYQSCLDFIRNLPLTTPPAVFGLNQNANFARNIQEAQQLLSGLVLTQPKRGNESRHAASETALELIDEILEKLPPTFDQVAMLNKYPIMYNECMNTVLQQEVSRYSQLTDEIARSLKDVKKAICGQAVMTSKLEDIFDAILLGKVPLTWESVSYPSMKPLGGYITDLLERLNFFKKWLDGGPPVVFWISGFFFSQAFLTGVIQNYARKHKIPIDSLTLENVVTEYTSINDIIKAPDDGAYIWGLFLEGARWDPVSNQLEESHTNNRYDPLPVIWLKPCLLHEKQHYPCYICPVYKTSARRGELSTTGHSTNFICNLDLQSSLPEKHWINRGVACICQLDK